jgi:hypothetical protein
LTKSQIIKLGNSKMTSLELITQTISTLSNVQLSKVETKELITLLHEIQKIPQLIGRFS